MKRISGSLALTALLAAAIFAGSAGETKAGPVYSFDAIGGPNTDTAIGEAQLSVEVNAVGANQVSFTFRNAGPLASSIAQVYFDDGTLLGIASVTNGPGVDFSQGGSPGNLPGGNTINFNTTAGFLATADPPVQPNGVNPGEVLTVTFNLINGKTFADTLAALALSLANPGVDVTNGLRIGIHVQGFADGGSESFVNGPPSAIPEPSTVVLALTGISTLGLTALRRRRRT